MALIVQKFGGTSVADVGRIQHVAGLVKAEVDQGNQVCVVVSAMSGRTNTLTKLVEDLGGNQGAERDMVLSSGEQVTAGLLAIALKNIRVEAKSFLGWQARIQTDTHFADARIREIKTDLLAATLKGGRVSVIAGFQGVSVTGEITTLGRGGSDTSAVALAAALKANRCDIYTDVAGVFTTDPNVVPAAAKLEVLSFEEMLELASLGAKVLHPRAVELAMRYDVPLTVRSSFNDVPGTRIVKEEEIMESKVITGITCTSDTAKITLLGVPDKPGIAAEIFAPVAAAGINVDMIVQAVARQEGATNVTFAIYRKDMEKCVAALKAVQRDIKFSDIRAEEGVAKVTVVGHGLESLVGVAAMMFKTLSDNGININVISTSRIKISVLIPQAHMELAVQTLHTAFGLDT